MLVMLISAFVNHRSLNRLCTFNVLTLSAKGQEEIMIKMGKEYGNTKTQANEN